MSSGTHIMARMPASVRSVSLAVVFEEPVLSGSHHIVGFVIGVGDEHPAVQTNTVCPSRMARATRTLSPGVDNPGDGVVGGPPRGDAEPREPARRAESSLATVNHTGGVGC